MIMGVAAVPLIAAVGAAVDYSRALNAKTAMQGAVDSVALYLAKEISIGSDPSSAQQVFSADFSRPEVQNVTVSSNVSQADGATTVAVTATGSINTAFLSVLGISTINLQATSSALTSTGTDGCVLALDGTANNAVSLGGSTNVNLNGCSVYSNSNSSAALSVGGSATLSALSADAVGTVSISSSNVSLADGASSHLQALRDPYADLEVPPFSGCTQTNLSVKTTLTISPGVYCNGLTVNAGATLTLNPGVYYIDRGTFSVNGGATINGKGVTIIFTSSTGSNWANLTINGNANVNLTASNGGPAPGLVIFGDPKMTVGTNFKLNGGSSQIFGGAIYAPKGAVSYSGGASTSTSCTQIIGDTVAFTGNSNVAINCSGYNTKPFGAIVLKLTS